MKAVILAAGMGSRLNMKPKPLLKVGGIEIILRSMKLLSNHVDEFIVVAGKFYDEIKSFLEDVPFKHRIIKNEHPEWGNGYSLKLAKDHVNGKFVLLMGDHIYSEDFIREAIRGEGLIVDGKPSYIDIEEATRVKAVNGRIENIGKGLEDYNFIDTGFFILDDSIFEVANRLPDDVSVSDIIRDARLRVYEVSGYFWTDVDTEEDLKKANWLLIESSIKDTDGLVSRYINRKISTRISALLINRVTPTQMTFVSFITGLISAFSLLFSIQAGALLYQLSSILDGCDGEIARASLRKSPFGGYIDSIMDRFVDFLFLGILAFMFPSSLLPALFAIFGSFMVSYTREKYKVEFGKKTLEDRTKYLIGKRDERVFIIMLFCLLGYINLMFWIIALLTNLRVLLTLVTVWRVEISEGGKR
jgi:CDP-L-myo-inositol myo-inositolphosphotransferase